MSHSKDGPTVVQRFRGDLLASRPRTTSKRLSAVAPVALVVAVALTLLIGSGQDGAPTSALAVTRADDDVVVRIADASAKPAEMTQELRQAGIDGVVLRAPATPDAVGTWVKVDSPRVAENEQAAKRHDEFNADREAEAANERLQGVSVEHDRVRIAQGFSDHLVLIVGQEPQAGEEPIYNSSGLIPPALPE